jgi:hypothetical protein
MSSHEGNSTNKAPLFNGTNFAFWKVRMRTYIMALGADVWDVVETGYVKPVVLANKDDKLEFSFNTKAMNAILSGLVEEEFVKVMHLGTAKEMWDKLINSYEGNEKVKDAKLQTYRNQSLQLTAYSDADWENCVDERKNTSGGAFFLGNSLVVWLSKKQGSISLSTTEAEYIAAATCCTQVLKLGVISFHT